MIGKIIGNYQITSELAQGGMGAVYRGRHLHLPREVVVKSVLLGPFSPSDQAHLRARFRREALVQSQLDHPNIVRVIPGQAEKNAGHTYRRRFGDELALVSGGEEAIAAKKQYMKALRLRPYSNRAKHGLAAANMSIKKMSAPPPETRRGSPRPSPTPRDKKNSDRKM